MGDTMDTGDTRDTMDTRDTRDTRDTKVLKPPEVNTKKSGKEVQTAPNENPGGYFKPRYFKSPSDSISEAGLEEAINIDVSHDTDKEHSVTAENLKNSELKCRHCSRIFKGADRFEKHQLAHYSEENPSMLKFSCATCGKRFPTNVRLNTHKVTHTTEKPFSCDYCDQAFNQSSNLLAHKKKTHTGLHSEGILV